MHLSKGDKLNIRVWKLFEKAGFSTQPNSSNPSEFVVNIGRGRPLDLYAEIPSLGVKIIGSNKSGGISGGSWTAHMNDCDSIKNTVGAQKCLLVATDHELDVRDMAHAKSLDIVVWTEDELSYFEELVASIGGYAKYEIIHSLGVTTTEESDVHEVLAIKLNQPNKSSHTELFAFSISPERLLKTSVIYRRAQGKADAYQRMLNKNRLPKIGKFLEEVDAILPTDIILHLEDNVSVQNIPFSNIKNQSGVPIHLSSTNNYSAVVLGIPMKYASTEIIDGQHRLYGFTQVAQLLRDNFNLVVVGIKNLDDKQKRETFVAINDNSRRMDPNLVAFLKYTTNNTLCQASAELMAIRIAVELNNQSPFKKSIKLLDIGKERLTLKGLSGYDLKGLLGIRGLLRKYNTGNDPDIYISMLRIYFSIFKTVFGSEWKNPDVYIIATNRGFSSLLKLLKSIIKFENGFPTSIRISEYAKALKKNWRTWETSKLKKTYVGAQGWSDFHKDLVKTIKKDSKFKKFKE